MDAQGWTTAKKPTALFVAAGGSTSSRKQSLCLCASIRLFWDRITNPSYRLAVEACEHAADVALSAIERETMLRTLDELRSHDVADWRSHYAVRCLIEMNPFPWRVMYEIVQIVRNPSGRQQLCAIARDVFGNPFRPIPFLPDWRTDTAVSLARTMYDAREFSAMPILADSLQDAGCDNDDVLSHCRDATQMHVRGCWVCDLVLNKA